MPIEFTINERLAGFVLKGASAGKKATIIFRELVGPSEALLSMRLDQLQGALFSKIPGLPHASRIGDLIVVINHDLRCHAYVDELHLRAKVKLTTSKAKGEYIYLRDISDITSVKLGLDIPPDAGFVAVRSFHWKRSLFYDFGPLHKDTGDRDYSLEHALAQQLLQLYGLPTPQPLHGWGINRIRLMQEGISQLEQLIEERCNGEREYQMLIERQPWILGTTYAELLRHQKMDDRSIPDFTALRSYDQCHDVVELKQPFLSLFREDGEPSADFNAAWNQCERYLDFCDKQRAYLRDEKSLKFENPRCILLMGYNLEEKERRVIRTKEAMNRLITVITYDQLLTQARKIYEFAASAHDNVMT